MLNPYEQDIQSSMIYQKSLDIFQLSRRVASYITDDKDIISMYRSGNKEDNYADNLVMNSSYKKLKYAKKLHYFIERIYQDCLILESNKIQGKDFVRMIRREINSLRKIHKSYVNSIL